MAGLSGIAKLLGAAGAGAAAIAPQEVDAAGLKQAIQAARIARQRLADEIAARFGDASSSSIPQRRAEQRLHEMDQKIEGMQKQLDQVNPDKLEWGPLKGADTLQDMFERYPDPKGGMGSTPRQMELRLEGGAVEDVPFSQVPPGHAVPDLYKRRAAQEKARALRGDMDEDYGDPDLFERSLYEWD